MKNNPNAATLTKQSPWVLSNTQSIFHREFVLVRDNLNHPAYRPLEIFKWIQANNGESLFFRGLARLAPLFPASAYHGTTAILTSPPPSGADNVIYMVMGHDINGALRLVGGNFFNEPKSRNFKPINPTHFFSQYDMANDREKFYLIADVIEHTVESESPQDIRFCMIQCERFHTMPVFVVVLTGTTNLSVVSPAVVDGDNPSDFSFEFLGEIK